MSPLTGPQTSADRTEPGPRERIIRAAYELFCQEGVQATGIDRIIADAGVAKASFYRHFPSKEDLVLAVLARREEVWTRDWLQRECEARAADGKGRLLAVFEISRDWFRRSDYEGCLFTNTMLESHAQSGRIGPESVAQLGSVRSLLRAWAEEAEVRDPAEFARAWQLLMLGAIVATDAGDKSAAERAGALGALLLTRETGES